MIAADGQTAYAASFAPPDLTVPHARVARMAFEDLIAKINLLLSDVENQPEDAHEQLGILHLELNQLRATGQPIPDDLARLETQLEEEFTSWSGESPSRQD